MTDNFVALLEDARNVCYHFSVVKVMLSSRVLSTFKEIYSILKAVTPSKLICFPSEKESTQNGTNYSQLEQIVSFKVEPFTEGAWYIGKQTRSNKIYLPFKNSR